MANYFTGVGTDEPVVNFITFESGAKFYALTTAITGNTTTTTATAGSLAITTNATGIGHLFYSDGSKWQQIA
jgi:hypothetical protein